MIVLPAPGSSARRKRSGVRGSSSPYTAVIWCGRACRSLVEIASMGSKRRGVVDAERLRGQPPRLGIAVECWPETLGSNYECGLLLTPQNRLVRSPVLVPVGDSDEVRAVPLCTGPP